MQRLSLGGWATLDVATTGIILNTEKHEPCRGFCAAVLGLPQLYGFGVGADEITVFAFGGPYLMVEHGGAAHPAGKPPATCPVKLRFNVANVEDVAETLRDKGVDINVIVHDWGRTAAYFDWNGDRCALRSDRGFGVPA